MRVAPHHQAAMEMAQAELHYGKNEQLRRIAQEIIVDQHQEIVATHSRVRPAATRSAPVPTQGRPRRTPELRRSLSANPI